MATIALPICDLERSVRCQAEKALTATESIVAYSRAKQEDFKLVLQLASGTLALRRKLSHLSTKQGQFISVLLDDDFNRYTSEALTGLATSLQDLVDRERELLDQAFGLGSEIRIWWKGSLRILSEQVEHLESIATSLRASLDSECEALLSLAIEEMS